MTKKFTHQGKEFEIRQIHINDEYYVRVYHENKQISPTYSVTTEIEQDYRSQQGKSIIDELEATAQNDVIRGIYIS